MPPRVCKLYPGRSRLRRFRGSPGRGPATCRAARPPDRDRNWPLSAATGLPGRATAARQCSAVPVVTAARWHWPLALRLGSRFACAAVSSVTCRLVDCQCNDPMMRLSVTVTRLSSTADVNSGHLPCWSLPLSLVQLAWAGPGRPGT